jgi:hypothetical protein
MSRQTEAEIEAMRRAHAITTAYVNRHEATASSLISEALAAGDGLEPALAAAHVTLRMALDLGEELRPGFRDRLLATIGEEIAAP